MLPSLSEQWATAYVQILLTIVIFAVGIPTLAMEIIAQEEVRHVARNRMKLTGWAITILIVSLLAFYSFVWVLHPPFPITKLSTESGSGTPAPTTINPKPSAHDSSQPTDLVATEAGGAPQNNEAQGNDEPIMTALVAGIIVTVIPILAIVFGLIQISALRRKKLIKELEDELLDSISSRRSKLKKLFNRMLWKKRIPHMLRDESLQDLIYLGEHGKPGIDKRLVLEALSRIAAKAQDPELLYKDGELEDLIKGLKIVVINNDKRGGDKDFLLAAKILKDIRMRLSTRPKISQHNDGLRARKVFEELCVEAVRHQAETTIKELLADASSNDIDIVFEVGLAALHAKQFHIATAALTKLEVLAEEQGLRCGDETANLLGLLAEFIANESMSTRRRASIYMRMNLDSFKPSLEDCLKAARKHHYLSNGYGTADNLETWLKMTESKVWLKALPADED